MGWINADLILHMPLDGAQAQRRYAPCGDADGAGCWSTPSADIISRENVVTGERFFTGVRW
jgi:hypothetical protein